jgi:hypothetical protein
MRVGSMRDVGKFSFAIRTGRDYSLSQQELVELEKRADNLDMLLQKAQ